VIRRQNLKLAIALHFDDEFVTFRVQVNTEEWVWSNILKYQITF